MRALDELTRFVGQTTPKPITTPTLLVLKALRRETEKSVEYTHGQPNQTICTPNAADDQISGTAPTTCSNTGVVINEA